ncbi:MAG: hypothetical protein EPN93_10245 [Spirochaetes bacterium]|nr:MAG: hypothetical protein EPN93_10245 [Spirochaetota bacterium]
MSYKLKIAAIILIMLGAFTFTGCSDEEGTETTTYAIGDTGPSGAGIVFYVTDGGLHGLEVAPVDQSAGAAWSDITIGLIGTTGTAIGTGSANTDAIIGQIGSSSSAAKICRDYRAVEEGDWVLPSMDELNAIYVGLQTIVWNPETGLIHLNETELRF